MLVLLGEINMKELSNEDLVDFLIRASSDNNEFDNREELEYYKQAVLKRMKRDPK